MNFILILCFLIICLFIPIPIRIAVNYDGQNFNFYLYNINITNKISFVKKKVRDDVEKKKNEFPKVRNTLRITFSIIKNLKYKPTLNIKINAIYGLDNAAHTALFYGLIVSFYPIILQLMNLLFSVKKSDVKVTPEFNKFILNFQIGGIIFINLAKITYMVFIIIKNIHKTKKLDLCDTY